MIVKPSAMQLVAAELSPRGNVAATAGLAGLEPKPAARGVKLSELTVADVRELRVLAAIEAAYPIQTAALGDRRASVTLAKWRARYGPLNAPISPGNPHENEASPTNPQPVRGAA